MDWKPYYRREWQVPGAREAMQGALTQEPEPAVVRAVARRNVLSFPHTALAEAGPLQASVVRALYDLGVERILALGVLHSGGVAAYRTALDEKAAASVRVEAFRIVRGAFVPDGDATTTPFGPVPLWKPAETADTVRVDRGGLLAAEFSLDTFVTLDRLAGDLFGRRPIPVLPLYVGMTRDPASGSFAAAEDVAERLKREVDAGTAIVATGDLVHYGTAYGGAWIPGNPTAVEPLCRALRPEVEAALTAAFVDRDWDRAYGLSRRRLGNDQREMGALLSAYLGPGATFSLLSFGLSDYSAILAAEPPCFVASALVRYGT